MFKKKSKVHQFELSIERETEPDRNFSKGGRSFYFFDIDDNVLNLDSSVYIYKKSSGEELKLSSGNFAQISKTIGVSGLYKDYEFNHDEKTGSFRNFRDKKYNFIYNAFGFQYRYQSFVTEILDKLKLSSIDWKGPSWDCFYYAVLNKRPLSLITARGHHPNTIISGISKIVQKGHLPNKPNYLSVFPVSHPQTQVELESVGSKDIAKLKQKAIRKSVEKAIEVYGANPHHRFGMSDDDPRNVELILEEMECLKLDYPEMSFFVFSVINDELVKKEVQKNKTVSQIITPNDQLTLFESNKDSSAD